MNPKSLTSWGDNHVWNQDDGFGGLGASGLCESPLIRKHPSSFYSLPPPDVTSNFQDEFGRHYIEDKEDIAADLNHCPLALSSRPSYLSLNEDYDHETTFNASMSFLPPGNHHWFMSKFPTERFGPSKKGSAKKLKALGGASSVVRKASTSSPTIDPGLENEDQTFGQIVGTLCMGFENVKTKGARRHQWQIAWSFPTFRWTIVLVSLWIWDELRRDFSVVVYHSHKPNRGLRSIAVLLVHFPRASTELEVEFFSKKG